MELDKTMEIGFSTEPFSTIFPKYFRIMEEVSQYFQCMLWRNPKSSFGRALTHLKTETAIHTLIFHQGLLAQVGKWKDLTRKVTAQLLCEGADFLNTVYFRRSLTCTLGLSNDLIDAGQPRAKPGPICYGYKVKPNHVSKTVLSPRLATVYQVIG